ncbi:MAG: hypothetical protein L6Q76_19995 [Polyangiaceae bacterium]|nr:hypothetical protein [Polyangiaceae bacterium]
MRRFFLVMAAVSAIPVFYGCTGDQSVEPWPGPDEVGERGPGATATVGAGGAGGEGGMGGMGGSPPMDCTNPAIYDALTKEVQAKLYVAQSCDPTLDEIKCDVLLPGMCCDEWVDPGFEDMNMPNVDAYLAALQAWKDAGCTCPPDAPPCQPVDPNFNFGFCNGDGFPMANQGLCQKTFP